MTTPKDIEKSKVFGPKVTLDSASGVEGPYYKYRQEKFMGYPIEWVSELQPHRPEPPKSWCRRLWLWMFRKATETPKIRH